MGGEEEYGTNREHAKLIYQNNMSEQATENNGLDLGPCEVQTSGESVVDPEKAALLETTKRLLEQSSQKVQSAVTETQGQKDKFAQQRLEAQDPSNYSNVVAVTEQNGHQELNGAATIKVHDLMNNTQKKEKGGEKKKRRFKKKKKKKKKS